MRLRRSRSSPPSSRRTSTRARSTWPSWMLQAARGWRAQITQGATAVIARITGPTHGETVFAWDSGAGPGTVGEGPELILSFGPAPATAPPLPTEAVIVATDTPTPANALTAEAQAVGATATVAALAGTPPAVAFRFVTPTPTAAKYLHGAGARAAPRRHARRRAHPYAGQHGNRGDGEVDRHRRSISYRYADPPASPLRHAGHHHANSGASQCAHCSGPAVDGYCGGCGRPAPTPLPPNVIIATITPPLFVIVDTPTPANEATATARTRHTRLPWR
jgi:hypothetical protein